MSTSPTSSDVKPPAKRDMRQEVAAVTRDPFLPTWNGILQPSDEVLLQRGGGKGYALYDEIGRDPRVKATLRKRVLAVLARPWTIEAGGDGPADQAAAELCERQVAGLRFDRICGDLLEAILKGFAVGEVMWEPREREMWVRAVVKRDQRRFLFDTEGRARLLTQADMLRGEELPAMKFLVHQVDAQPANPYGEALGRTLFWPVWFKREGIRFWMAYLEKYGQPTTIGKHTPGADDKAVAALLDVMRSISQETGIAIPDDTSLEFLEAKRTGGADYQGLVRYMDEQIAEAVLGETLTTNVGQAGSRAASETHNDVREELTDADADLLSETVNQLLRWITLLNFPPGTVPPTLWRRRPDDEDLNQRAERDTKIHALGFEPTQEYIDATYGAGFLKKAPASPFPMLAPQAGQNPMAPPVSLAEGTQPPDTVDALVEQLDALAEEPWQALLETVRDAVMDPTVKTLTEISDRLLKVSATLPPEALAALIAEALAVAELSGRADLVDGAR